MAGYLGSGRRGAAAPDIPNTEGGIAHTDRARPGEDMATDRILLSHRGPIHPHTRTHTHPPMIRITNINYTMEEAPCTPAVVGESGPFGVCRLRWSTLQISGVGRSQITLRARADCADTPEHIRWAGAPRMSQWGAESPPWIIWAGRSKFRARYWDCNDWGLG